MIALLTGEVHEKTEKSLTFVAGSVGYEVFCAPTLLEQTKVGDQMTLYTHQYVREDAMELYGFTTADARLFFRQLISVSGVGPKSALTVMALTSLDELKRAIAQGDATLLTKVSGIGKKTAERLVVELRQKMEDAVGTESGGSVDGDAIDALIGLGYSSKEARDALRYIGANAASTSARVQAALKILGKE